MRKKRVLISDELAELETIEERRCLNSEQFMSKIQLLKEFMNLLKQEESY
jgi:hypothetical protein